MAVDVARYEIQQTETTRPDLHVVPRDPIYEEEVFLAAVAREVDRIRQPGGDQVIEGHLRSKTLLESQLTDYKSPLWPDAPPPHVFAVEEQVRLHTAVLAASGVELTPVAIA